MAYNLVKLSQMMEDEKLEEIAKKQLTFMASYAKDYPTGHSFYLLTLSLYLNPPVHIVCATNDHVGKFPMDSNVIIIKGGNEKYPILSNKTTYYVCKNKTCLPPTNNLEEVL